MYSAIGVVYPIKAHSRMCSTRPAYRRASPSRVVRTYVGASYTSLCTFELCTLSNTMATIGTPPHAQLVYILV